MHLSSLDGWVTEVARAPWLTRARMITPLLSDVGTGTNRYKAHNNEHNMENTILQY